MSTTKKEENIVHNEASIFSRDNIYFLFFFFTHIFVIVGRQKAYLQEQNERRTKNYYNNSQKNALTCMQAQD